METLELLEIIQNGENSYVQFKRRVKDAHSISQEISAFANFKGGTLIIGVEDKTGELNGLSFTEIEKNNNTLANAASDNVKPSLFIQTEQITIKDDTLIVVKIPEGINKPYKDKKGAIWLKNGSDKRRVTSNEELARLLQSSKNIYADEQTIPDTSLADLDVNKFDKYLKNRYNKNIDDFEIDIKQLASNTNLIKANKLTLTALLLFGKQPQKHRPLFTIQCVAFTGNSINSTQFKDKEQQIDGDLKTIFEKSMSFIKRNLHKIQVSDSFNSNPKSEIPLEVFEELFVNAFIHRNYFINSTVKLFIFQDRIEIISPGVLPNSLTVENIKSGISIQRNPTLQSIAQFILPYSGLGTGISRITELYSGIEFENNISKEQFITIIKRTL